MTTPAGANIATGSATVGFQAQAIHGDIYYQVPPDASPEEKFAFGVRYLDARMPAQAQKLIEEAAAWGHRTDEVHFHRLLALLSGRNLRQLASEDFDRLSAIWHDVSHSARPDEWRPALMAIFRLLASLHDIETEPTIKEVESLPREQRDKIFDHLAVLLEGPMEDQMWLRSLEQAADGQMANRREERIWKFFHPDPAGPRVRRVAPAAIRVRDRVLSGAGAGLFAVAVGKILLLLLLQRPSGHAVLGVAVGVAGLAAFMVGGADRHFRRERRRAKEAELSVPRQRRAESSGPGFARDVDRLFDRYFKRYVPRHTDRSHWLVQTAGIRRHLRDELVEIYREQRVDAEQIAWLVRHLVGDVRRRWEHDTLTAHRRELRTPPRSVALIIGGLLAAAGGGLSALPAIVRAGPVAGSASILVVIVSAAFAVRSSFRILTQWRRVAADQAERADQYAMRRKAFERWRQKLSDRPSDQEMAAWLECDRKLLVGHSMRQYRLRASQVIAHAFIEAPGRPYKRARYLPGPWRYSRYRLLLFLLTDDGVRQVTIDLDLQAATFQTTQRLNYRFDAIAAVCVGVGAQRQTFELTLVNGEPLAVPVTESNTEGIRAHGDPIRLAELSLDASGLSRTLHVLEGVAAEGKEWVRHQLRRADLRLTDLTGDLDDLIDRRAPLG